MHTANVNKWDSAQNRIISAGMGSMNDVKGCVYNGVNFDVRSPVADAINSIQYEVYVACQKLG